MKKVGALHGLCTGVMPALYNFLIKSADIVRRQAATDGMFARWRVFDGGKMWRWLLEPGFLNRWNSLLA